jgi:uncharacterized protein (TIGR02996 family)
MSPAASTDPDERSRLEAERDVLLRSLDDLENERADGGIDEESYRTLHDDYTARAAAAIRTLRDGVDSRPTEVPKSRSRRLVVVAVIVVFAIGAGVALATSIGDRLPGQTGSGNTPAVSTADPTGAAVRKKLQDAIAKNPNDVASRLLFAQFLAEKGDLEAGLRQWDEVIEIDPTNAEAYAQSGRALYIVGTSAPASDVEAIMQKSKARLDKAVTLDPGFADARYFRSIVLAYEFQDYRAAQGDLQRYLLAEPDGTYAEDARTLLAQVTDALESPSTTVP